MTGHASVDEMFDVLSHHRRRAALDVLLSGDEPLSLVDVAEEVAGKEQGEADGSLPAEDVRPIYVELYHVHVPKLADHGLVEFDRDRGSIELAEAADQVTPLLEAASALE